ncbi:amylo-alpha-1,6-glucosidase [Knoellia aerolata]|uniref:Amylo-alpha-1,6-glucosidase n=1 Tax=Knoellia aerolata DSM 18566 TaxID=1385519 RepID=A0A0A0JZM9_9MICO|nr:glycogen debranching N-terminal domain-containing protein [Knoellia aerolata]KGN42209.1 hypothetical protein N801_01330 [Knoellia aerolata DSM 18566]
MTRYVQPWLHEFEIAVRGNVTSVSDRHGDAGRPGTGLFVDDRRVLSVWEVRAEGERPAWLAAASSGPTTTVSTLLRSVGDAGADPTVELLRERVLVDQGMHETLTIASHAAAPVEVRLSIRLGGDGADVGTVKGGVSGEVLPTLAAGDCVTWEDERHTTTFTANGGAVGPDDGGGTTWVWSTTVVPGGTASLRTRVTSRRRGKPVFATDAGWHAIDWDGVAIESADPRPGRLMAQSLADLRGLLLTDPEAPGDVFAAAGTPWYLTLFGRDSLWTARFMLPFGTDLARGTLRALARRQGTATDSITASAPGKVLHEVRRSTYVDPVTGMRLPPVYYGSVDATPLWVRLLHDAWRWGLDEQVVRELEPNLRAALSWMRAEAGRGDGMLRYVDESGSGLENQGWKDSGDSMRRSDGTIADAPIALVETQAYAVAAARGAAHLFESVFGESGDEWRTWADEMTDTLRERFWVDSPSVRHLAMAIGGDGRPVDGVGSNMGHVLGTGVLSAPEARRTAHALTAPDMLGAAGVRTLSRDNPAYNPVGYHTGSVWTHDNAIAALGLAQEGFTDEAARVLGALVEVGSWTGNRWPELFGGELLIGRPVPYPASCRPQAWAAASAGALVEVVLGLSADAPNRTLAISPISPAPFGATTVRGIRVGDVQVSVSVNADGEVVDVQAPGLEVVIG